MTLDVMMDEPTVYLRRDARSLKNEFQSSGASSLRGVFEVVEFVRMEAGRGIGENFACQRHGDRD